MNFKNSNKNGNKAVAEHISKTIDSKLGLVSVPKIREAIWKDLGFKMSKEKVKKIMKLHLSLEWKNTSSQQKYVNAHKNLVLRQMFVVTLLKVME